MPRRAALPTRRFPVVTPTLIAPVTTVFVSVLRVPRSRLFVSALRVSRPRLFLKLGVDPVHLRAQLASHELDLVAGLLLAHPLKALLPGEVLGDPLAREIT